MKRMIYYCDIKYAIRTYRGSTPKVTNYVIKKMVCKNPDDPKFKVRLLKEHYKGKSNVSKLISGFDLKNIYIRFVCVHKKLGYENKSS